MRLEVDLRLALDRFELALQFESAVPVTGVFGHSGSGKSSLLESVAGLRRSARGRIVAGDRVWLDTDAGVRLPPEAREVGYVPQDGLLFPHRNVEQNLRAGERRAARTGSAAAELFATVLRLLELEPLLGRTVASLSGGERQRVALGRALCSGPRLLLLDEPLAALDLPLRRRILPLLERVRRELEVPILLVSHDPVEIQALCDDVLVLREGEIIARGRPRQVLTDPAVFPLAARDGFENTLACRVVRSDADTSRVRLLGADGEGEAGPELEAVPGMAEAGERTFVGVSSRDIFLALDRPEGISARNVLPARVVQVAGEGQARVVRLALVGPGEEPSAAPEPRSPVLAVELTSGASAELGIAVGREVFVVIKATACILYTRRARG